MNDPSFSGVQRVSPELQAGGPHEDRKDHIQRVGDASGWCWEWKKMGNNGNS